MNILYLHQYFTTPKEAGGTRSYEMGRRLVQAGHEVHMITSERQTNKSNSNHWVKTMEAGIHVHRLAVPYSNKMAYGDRLKAFFKFALMAAAKTTHIDCDVVFATSTPLTIAIPAVRAARKNRCPLVFEVRDLWPAIPIAIGALNNPLAIAAARRLERFAYEHSSRIIALSPGMQKGVVSTGYPEKQTTVIPNSCDLDLFNIGSETDQQLRQKYDWLGQRPLVLYAGTMGIMNGVDYMARLAAATRAIDPEIRFLVIGSGKEENKVEEEARKLGVLGHNFFMMPPIPKSELPKWLCAADICLSLFIDIKLMWANSANKFFDALAAGKPIAVNYGGWQADILSETGAGLVLKVDDVEFSAKLLSSAVRDKVWPASAGTAARKIAEQRFDRDKLARQLEDVLKDAVCERFENKTESLDRTPGRQT